MEQRNNGTTPAGGGGQGGRAAAQELGTYTVCLGSSGQGTRIRPALEASESVER